MAELLIEFFSEEIPAKMQRTVPIQFQNNLSESLKSNFISYEKIAFFATPRRITFVVSGLPEVQVDNIIEKKGPMVGAKEQAIDGFIKSSGITKEQLVIKSTPKGDFYFIITQQKGRKVKEILPEIIATITKNFTWPKSMRWGNYDIAWVRPLHSIICLFNGKILPIIFGPIKASNTTSGHRFLAPDIIEVKDFADYNKKLQKAYVVLDHKDRRDLILEQISKITEKLNLQLKNDDELLEEIAGIVEYPVVILGNIANEFMYLPEEVLISVMRTHQKYLALEDKNANLAPYFIAVANIKARDNGKKITEGFNKVLKARLSDAKFFYDHDKSEKLANNIAKLDTIIFHAKLGSVGQKVNNIEKLAYVIADYFPKITKDWVKDAANLCKADLVSNMVLEFPELQGIMGRYYALASGYNKEVAQAIYEHYLPIAAGGDLPQSDLGKIIALSDKIDSLVGLFAINQIPTGSKDPFALRRACIGVVRIIISTNLDIKLSTIFEKALDSYAGILKLSENQKAEILKSLLDFIIDRFKVILQNESISHDLLAAVFESEDKDNLVKLYRKILSLKDFVLTNAGKDLLSAYKRATNIVKAEEKKDQIQYQGAPDAKLLELEEEKKIYSLFADLKPEILKAIQQDDYIFVMQTLARLQNPINDFFDKVVVNTENKALRQNRLLLLATFRDLLAPIANFDAIIAS